MKRFIKHSFYAVAFVMILAFTFAKPAVANAASYKTADISEDGKKVKVNGLKIYSKDIKAGNGYSHELHVVKNKKDVAVFKTKVPCYFSGKIVTNGSKVYFLVNDSDKDNAKIYEYRLGKKANCVKTFKKSSGDIEGCYNNRMYLTVEDPKEELKYKLISYSLKDKKIKNISKADYLNVVASNNQYYWIRYTKTGKVVLFNAKNNKMKTIIDRGMERVYVKGNKCYYIVVHKESMKNVGWDEEDFGIWEDFMDGPVKIDIYRMNMNGSGKKALVKNLEVREIQKFTNKTIKYKDAHKKAKTKNF